jgi:hypothetical protein
MDLLGCKICGKEGNLLRCSRCKLVKYCTKEHQLSDWPEHKLECARMAKINSAPIKSEPKQTQNEADDAVDDILTQGGGTRARSKEIPLDQISFCGNHFIDEQFPQAHPLNVCDWFLLQC